MAIITTHPGGLYYEWRTSVVGSPPPHTFNEDTDAEGVLYHDWQHGTPKDVALSSYMQRLGVAAAGVALTLPVSPASGLPSPPPPPPAPAAAPAQIVEAPIAQAAALPFGLTSDEVQNIDIVLNAGLRLRVNDLALLTAATIGWGENHWNNITCNKSDHCGVFQISSDLQATHDRFDLAYWADRAYRQGFYSYGGIIELSQRYPNASPGRLANMVQGAYSDLDQGQAYYDAYIGLARDTIRYFLPGLGKGLPPVSPTFVGTGGSRGGAPAAQPGGVFDLFKQINWAGDFENLWKYAMGGANEAANMAKLYNERILEKLDFINWPH